MIGQSDRRWVLVAVIAVGVLGAAGPGASLAQFSDEHAGTGTATAASKFGGAGGGDDVLAFDDANGNGIRDDGEATYTRTELQNFDDPGADLVIPAGVGPIEAKGNDAVSITAGSISAAVDVGAHKQDVRLVATDGDVDVAGSNLTVDKKNGRVTVTAAGDVDLSGSRVITQSGSIVVESDGAAALDDATLRVEEEDGHVSVTGWSVSATGVDVDTVTGTIELRATAGAADLADGALAVDGGYGAIELRSVGNVTLDSATLATANAGATVDLGIGSATLFVENLTVNDDDGTLEYRPSDAIERPERDDVVPAG